MPQRRSHLAAHLLTIAIPFAPVVLIGLAVLIPVVALVVCCFGCAGLGTYDQAAAAPELVHVTGHRWERSVGQEELRTVSDEDWCDDIPTDARVLSSERRWNSTRDLQDDWCTYEEDVWSETARPTLTGATPDDLAWPEVADDGCTHVGCQRPGSRRSTYTLEIERASTGEADTCDLDEAEWAAWRQGEAGVLPYGAVLDEPSCSRLRRPEAP